MSYTDLDKRRARQRAYQAEQRRLNPEKIREYQRVYQAQYRRDHPEKTRQYRRTAALRADYGISDEQYEVMLRAQDGHCAICPATEPGGRGNFFHVDHDHETGRVRGLLCHSCNTSLGHFRDSPERLRAAALYLEKARAA